MKNDSFYTQILFAKYTLTPQYIKGQKRAHDFEFYRSGRFIDYITREKAVYKQKDEPFNKQALQQYLKEHNLTPQQYFATNYPETKSFSGLMQIFDKEAKYVSKQEAKSKMADLSDRQMVWELTINLGEFGKDNLLYNKHEWAQSLNTTLPFLLKKKNLTPNQVDGYYAIHKNTEYPHIHMCIYEKEPLRYNSNNEPVYTQKGKFDYKDINYFKHIFKQSFVNRTALEEMYDNQKQLIALKKRAKTLFQPKAYDDIKNNHTQFIDSINFIKNELKDKKNIAYQKQPEYIKQQVQNVFKQLLNFNPELTKELANYTANLNQFKDSNNPDEFFKLKKEQFAIKEEQDLNNYFYNQVIKMCLYSATTYFKKQITNSISNSKLNLTKPFINNNNYKPSSKDYIKQFKFNRDAYFAFLKKKQEAMALFNNYIKYPHQLDNQTVYTAPNVPYYMKVNKLK